MTEKTYREALTDALFLEMRRDENVFVMGEDVVGGTGSPHAEPGFVGGVFVRCSANSPLAKGSAVSFELSSIGRFENADTRQFKLAYTRQFKLAYTRPFKLGSCSTCERISRLV